MKEQHPRPVPPRPTGDAHALLFCTDVPVLCRVRVYTDAEWDALPTSERPRRAERVDGVGWVVAVPVEHLN
jgi:hypothetical protein